MRRSIMLGFMLTAASVLSLISYNAGASAPPTPMSHGYAIAITMGAGLRLVSPESPAAGGPLVRHGHGVSMSRTLSCSGVVRLGIADVGYRCVAPSAGVETGSL